MSGLWHTGGDQQAGGQAGWKGARPSSVQRPTRTLQHLYLTTTTALTLPIQHRQRRFVGQRALQQGHACCAKRVHLRQGAVQCAGEAVDVPWALYCTTGMPMCWPPWQALQPAHPARSTTHRAVCGHALGRLPRQRVLQLPKAAPRLRHQPAAQLRDDGAWGDWSGVGA